MKIKSRGVALDAGCGDGFFTGLLEEMGFESYGIDVDKERILHASKTYSSNFIISDSRLLPFCDQTFDFILCRGLSTFYGDDNACIKQSEVLLSMLKVNGFLVFISGSDLTGRRTSIRNHRMQDVLLFFTKPSYNRSVYFIFAKKYLVKSLHGFAFSSLIITLSYLMTKLTGHGGYIVCVIKRKH
ncbi:MAG: class I SAM-dependent methyltransferase [Nitrososphaeraceae archaeon]